MVVQPLAWQPLGVLVRPTVNLVLPQHWWQASRYQGVERVVSLGSALK
ncbi:hypothetical protein KC19_1G270800 [Ceratodon purpureus]|uniref:Uncharacterized protein n=1 Tax=Ceratodon purpureus TaxID=3225 RepID=A0A8T0JCN1_CERPU|nr:hypothetical protein KC19_1G270800 [Ceratodon purpureus]